MVISPVAVMVAAATLPVAVTLSTKASFHLTPVVPKSTSLSVSGPKIPSATYTCSALSAYRCISFAVSKSILVCASSPIIKSSANTDVIVVWAAVIAISFALAVIPSPPITFKVLVAAIVPPPVSPVPAVTLTPLWSMCSFATNPLKLS